MRRLSSLRLAVQAIVLSAATVLGCAGGDDNTGVGGVLVVSQVVIEGGNRIVLIGGTRQLQATPRTSTGIAVPGKAVVWSSANNGRAQVSSDGVVTGIAAGVVSITAVVDGVTGRIEIDVRPVPVAAVEVTASVQTLEAGQTTQLEVVTLDSVGGVLPGRQVAWSSSNNAAATVSPIGLVTAVGAGSTLITATSEGKSGSLALVITARPASRLGFVVQPTDVTAGLAITPPIQVAFQDQAGGTATTAAGSITLSFSSNPTGATLSGTLTAPAVQGIATFPDLRVNRTGQSYSLQAVATGFGVATSASFTVTAGAPASLAIVTQPAGGSASGGPLAQQPVIQLRDAQGNDSRQAGVTVTAVVASGPGTLTGALSVLTGSDGRAVFTNLGVLGATGSYTLRFASDGLTAVTSSPFSVGAGLATQLTFTSAPPSTAVNGQPLGATVIVQLRDATGNPVAQPGVLVTASVESGTGVLSGTVATTTGTGGSAAFSGLVITGIAGNIVLGFSTPGVSPAVSNSIALQAGAATQLTFTTAPPATGTNGVDLSPAVVVQLRDVSGNLVSTAGVTVTASLVTGAGGSLGGTTTVVTVANGSATFSALRITGAVGQYTLRFSASGVSAATANPLTLQPGAATALAIQTQPPPSTTSGSTLSPQPVIRVVDQSGNTVTSSSLAVTASLASGPGTLGGTLTRSAVNGIATFTNLAITGTTGTYTIAFNGTGVTGVTSGTIGLGAGAAAALQFVGTPPTSGTNGAALASAIAVRLVDGSLNPVAQSGVSVSAVLASGPGSLGGTVTVTTDGNGIATFGNLILTGTVGSYTIRFEVSGITPVTTPTITLTAGAASQLAFTTAPSSSAVNGAALVTQPVVRLQDASGNPVSQSGVTITAAITVNPGGSLSNASAVTAGNGQATFSGLTITGLLGLYTISYGSGALTPVSATVSLSAGPAVAVKIVTQPSASATNTVAFAQQPVVRLVDQSGNFTGANGTAVTAALGQTPGPAALGGTTTVLTGTPGVRATFTNLAISGTTGTYTLVFSSPGLTSEESSAITVAAGAASQLAFITAPSVSAINGAILNPQPVVELRDASNNPVLTAGVNVTASLVSGPGSLLGTLTVQTAGNGRATFSNLELRGLAGNYTIRFTAGALTLDSDPIALAIGPASRLLFDQAPPATATNGATFSASTIVRLADAGGNLVTTDGVSVLTAVASGPGATLGGTTTRQTVSGQATFDNLSLTGTAGIYTLDFTSGSLTKATSNSITLEPGPATKLIFLTTTPATAQSGVVFVPAPVVQLQDASSNNVPQSGVSVTAARFSGDTTAIVSGGSVVTDALGRATFSSLAITGPGGDYGLAFASPPLAGLLSPTITLTAGGAAKLGFVTAPPATATNGQALGQQPVVRLLDAANNPVAESGRSITIAMPEAGSLTAGALTVMTDGSGHATFSGVTITGLVGARTLTFSGSGLSTLTSGTISLVAGPPAALAMVTQPPASATSGATLAPSPAVRLVDQSGNNVAEANVNVTVAVSPAGTLGGTTTVATDGSGIATFAGLSITAASGNYQLGFTAPPLTGVSSNTITISAASGLSLTTQPSATVRNDIAFAQQPTIQLVDAGNGPVAISGVVVTAALASGGGNLLGSLTATTNAAGAATFADLRIRGLVGTRTIEFTAAGLTSATSDNVEVTPGVATAIAVVTQPAGSAVANEPLATAPVVRLVDVSGNTVDSAGVDLTVAVSPAGAALAGTTTVATGAGGAATFSGLSLGGDAGTYRLVFSGTSLTDVESGNVTLLVPATIQVTTEPAANATSGVPLAPQPSVTVLDGAAAAMVGVSVTATLVPVGGGSATLGGTVTVVTGAGGTATWTNLVITGSAGDYRLQFTTANGVTVASAVVTVIP